MNLRDRSNNNQAARQPNLMSSRDGEMPIVKEANTAIKRALEFEEALHKADLDTPHKNTLWKQVLNICEIDLEGKLIPTAIIFNNSDAYFKWWVSGKADKALDPKKEYVVSRLIIRK